LTVTFSVFLTSFLPDLSNLMLSCGHPIKYFSWIFFASAFSRIWR